MTGTSTKPRIAHVISTRWGAAGAERLLGSLVTHSAERYDQLLLNPFMIEGATSEKTTLEELCPPSVYRSYPSPPTLKLGSVRTWLHAELDDFQPDIVHAVLPRAVIAVASLRRRPHVKRLLTHVHGDAFHHMPLSWAKEAVDRWAGSRYDRVVAISTAGERYLLSRHGYPRRKVVLIPPGWEGTPLVGARDALPPTIVCVAKLRPEKGHDVLLEAFRIVQEAIGDSRLVLVGEGPLKSALQTRVRDLGIQDSVDFAGEVEDPWRYLAVAHVFALASHYEAFGMAIVEAMAARLPVVAPAVGGIPDIVSPGVSGELFPRGDHRAMAKKIIDLLKSSQRREEMGNAAHLSAQKFRMENTIRQYFALYRELLDDEPHDHT